MVKPQTETKINSLNNQFWSKHFVTKTPNMLSETIWSSGHNSPIQNNLLLASTTTNNTSQYKSVIDQVDPDVIRLFANSNSFDPLSSSTGPGTTGHTSGLTSGTDRRLSFNDGSDIIESDFWV